MDMLRELAPPPVPLIVCSGSVLRLILLLILLSFVLPIRRVTMPRAETRLLLTVVNMVLGPGKPSLLVMLISVRAASSALTGRPCPCTVWASLLWFLLTVLAWCLPENYRWTPPWVPGSPMKSS